MVDPSEPSKRHRPAYPEAVIAALVNYAHQLTGGGGPDIPHLEGGDLAEGGALFRLQCAACHAWAGDGGALLDVDAPSLRASTPNQVAEAIRVGPGQMPAFGVAALTDEQVSSVVAYVRFLDDVPNRGGRPLWRLGPVAEGGVALIALVGLLLFTPLDRRARVSERPSPQSTGPEGTGETATAERRAEKRVVTSFLVSAAAAVGLAVVYMTGGNPQLEGTLLAVSLAGLAVGFVMWANHLMPKGPFVDARHDPEASEAELDEVESDVERGGILTRRK